MSSAQRRPARQAPNLWPRRIITGTGLLLVIALIVWGVFALIGLFAGGASNAESPQSTTSSKAETVQSGTGELVLGRGDVVTEDGIVSNDTTVTIPRCAEAELDYSATAVQTTVGAGEKLETSIENRSKVACSTALGRLSLQILTGDQTVYDSAQCESRDETATPLLLAPNEPWTGTIDWDGLVYTNGCSAPEGGAQPASEGTYRAVLLLDGLPVIGEQVFTVVAAPAAEE